MNCPKCGTACVHLRPKSWHCPACRGDASVHSSRGYITTHTCAACDATYHGVCDGGGPDWQNHVCSEAVLNRRKSVMSTDRQENPGRTLADKLKDAEMMEFPWKSS
jgi:hypothetical protein